MAMSDLNADQAWSMLANAEEEERRAKMLQRYTEMAALSEEDRASQMLTMANAEYALPDDKLRTFTVSRLSVWLALDLDAGKMIADSYDTAMRVLPGPQAMRRVSMVQTLADEFSKEQQQQLIALVPGVFGGLKHILSMPTVQTVVPSTPSETAKKGWWPFGKR